MKLDPIILLFGVTILGTFSVSAQFHTITRNGIDPTTTLSHITYNAEIQPSPADIAVIDTPSKSLCEKSSVADKKEANPKKQHINKSSKKRAKQIPLDTTLYLLPLNLPNIVTALRRYGIKYPRIVLAQAIQETGWLRSNVCLTKHNLFGLTNPYTGEYYEFNHWSESVRAYYTLVQYKYTSGNYYQWLEEIGYAGDPNYVNSLRKIIKLYL